MVQTIWKLKNEKLNLQTVWPFILIFYYKDGENIMAWKIGDGSTIELVGHINSEGELFGVTQPHQGTDRAAAPAERFGVIAGSNADPDAR